MKYYDVLVIFSVLLFWTAHASTISLIAFHQTAAATVQEANAIVQVLETNPIARLWLLAGNAKFILSFLLTPALILGTYVFFRRRTNEKLGSYGAESIAWIFFFVAATNALNDVTILASVMLR